MSEPTAAQRLLNTLRDLRTGESGGYPPSLAELLRLALPDPEQFSFKKLLADRGLKGQLLVAVKNKPESPVALVEDRDALAASDRLLVFLLELTCTGKTWKVTPEKLASKLVADLRPPFLQSLDQRQAAGRWPDGVECHLEGDTVSLGLSSRKPALPAHLEVVRRLTDLLLAEKTRGPAYYPLPLDRLVAQLDPPVAPAVLKKALADRAFTSAAILAAPKKPHSPVALAEDEHELGVCDATLVFCVREACSGSKSLVAWEALQGRLAPSIQSDFVTGLLDRLESNRLPDGVGAVSHDGTWMLYRTDAPPSAPWLLAVRLKKELERRRQAGTNDYPAPVEAVTRAVQPDATPANIRTALKEKILKGAIVVAMPNEVESPVALAGDEARLADSPDLLPVLLGLACTPANQALPITELKKKLAKPLQSSFVLALDQRLTQGQLPEGVAAVRIKKVPYLFRLRDVTQSVPAIETAPAPAVAPATPPPIETPARDFASDFNEVFAALDRNRGGHNLVSLVELRRELAAYTRHEFDVGLRSLRLAGRYTLSQAEGRHGLSPEEHEAAVHEDGALLLHASRRVS